MNLMRTEKLCGSDEAGKKGKSRERDELGGLEKNGQKRQVDLIG